MLKMVLTSRMTTFLGIFRGLSRIIKTEISSWKPWLCWIWASIFNDREAISRTISVVANETFFKCKPEYTYLCLSMSFILTKNCWVYWNSPDEHRLMPFHQWTDYLVSNYFGPTNLMGPNFKRVHYEDHYSHVVSHIFKLKINSL